MLQCWIEFFPQFYPFSVFFLQTPVERWTVVLYSMWQKNQQCSDLKSPNNFANKSSNPLCLTGSLCYLRLYGHQQGFGYDGDVVVQVGRYAEGGEVGGRAHRLVGGLSSAAHTSPFFTIHDLRNYRGPKLVYFPFSAHYLQTVHIFWVCIKILLENFITLLKVYDKFYKIWM